jgi:hypothetical protein
LTSAQYLTQRPHRMQNEDSFWNFVRISFLRLRQIPINYPQFPSKIKLSHPKRQGQKLNERHKFPEISKPSSFR